MEEKNDERREAKGFPPTPSQDGVVNTSNANSSSVSLQSPNKSKGYYTKKYKKEKKVNDGKDWNILHEWDQTCNLPDTNGLFKSNFPYRKQKDSEILEKWKQINLYQLLADSNPNGNSFILHDGPPFANGGIHLGHSYNKILKDIICKYKWMEGNRVHFRPGFDCHGLPIELKVENRLKLEGKSDAISDKISDADLISECRREAEHWISIQTEEFQSLGVTANWNHPYKTMDSHYESKVLESINKLHEANILHRKWKTILWCSKCKTVLSSAEIELKNIEEMACYIMFPLWTESYGLLEMKESWKVFLLVWTTAPWSLPMNAALALRDNSEYSLIQLSEDKAILVGSKVASNVAALLKIPLKILCVRNSNELSELRVCNPFTLEDSKSSKVILSEFVSINDGTAILHIAPSCGVKDYSLGVKHQLDTSSYVSEDGRYNSRVTPSELIGKDMKQGNEWILDFLKTKELVLNTHLHKHQQPHCWRCGNQSYYKPTEQWFIETKENIFKAKKISEKLNFLPKNSKSSFTNTLAARDDWCVSRQRKWGIPIPHIKCVDCGHIQLDSQVISFVSREVEKHGIEIYAKFRMLSDLKEVKVICGQCKNENVDKFELGRDTLDVWFVSSLSHVITLPKEENSKKNSHSDLVIEGLDQHRGWFSSSLLTSLMFGEKSFTSTLISHAFVSNHIGEKLSKSRETSRFSLQDAKKSNNMDVIRLWVASTNFDSNMMIGSEILDLKRKEYRKIRKTFRHIIGNLSDFSPKNPEHILPLNRLCHLDKLTLANLLGNFNKIKKSFESFDFVTACKILLNFTKSDLRSSYFESLKDRLYFGKIDGIPRRSAQTTLWFILEKLTLIIAPIYSFLAEEAHDFLTQKLPETYNKKSIHLYRLEPPFDIWKMVAEAEGIRDQKFFIAGKHRQAAFSEKIRLAVLREVARLNLHKTLNSSVKMFSIQFSENSHLIESLDDDLKDREGVDEYFRELAGVSFFQHKELESREEALKLNATEIKEIDKIFLVVESAEGVECPRCWRKSKSVHPKQLCERCSQLLKL